MSTATRIEVDICTKEDAIREDGGILWPSPDFTAIITATAHYPGDIIATGQTWAEGREWNQDDVAAAVEDALSSPRWQTYPAEVAAIEAEERALFAAEARAEDRSEAAAERE